MAARKNLEQQGMAIPKMVKRWWLECHREWTLVLHSPLVIALASGNLELDTFHNFASQEQHFYKCYTQVLRLAMPKRNDLLLKLENCDSFLSFLNICNLDFTKEYPENIATVKYRDFLLATAAGKVEDVILATPIEKIKIPFYTLAAMMPHRHMCAFIGKELQSLLDPSGGSHPYKFWIDRYISSQASTLNTEDVLDKLGVSLTGEERVNMQRIYHHAMKLELEFLSAQPMRQKTVVPLLKEHNPSKHHLMIFSNFDLTCNAIDTSTLLAEVSIASKSDQVQSQNQNDRMPSGDLRKTWDLFSKMYAEEYERCIENILTEEEGKKVKTEEYEGCIANKFFSGEAEKFNYTVLKEALEKLSEIEESANARVIKSGLLKGLNLEDIKRASECLFLKDGCISFFQSIAKNENISASIDIFSHCWCTDLIMSAFSSEDLNILDIHANELTYENSISTGDIAWKIVSPINKADCFWFTRERKKWFDKRDNLTVYIGDSVDDLLCLVQADIGIVINAKESLKKVASRFGVSFVRLFDALVEKQKEMVEEGSSCIWDGGLSGILYTVSSWAEIHSFILGSYT